MACDAPEPCLETGATGVKLAQVFKGRHEALLHHFVDVGPLADETCHEARQCSAVAADQQTERFCASAEYFAYELLFVLRHIP